MGMNKLIRELRNKLSLLWLKLGLNEQIYYINGPETLPPPLTKAEEEKVMLNIMNDVPNAREPLITHNLRLVVYIAKKFESNNAGVEDLISIDRKSVV